MIPWVAARYVIRIIFLMALIPFIMTGCASVPGKLKTSHSLDEFGRVAELYTYYEDRYGTKVRHGVYYRWERIPGYNVVKIYDRGSLTSGRFLSSVHRLSERGRVEEVKRIDEPIRRPIKGEEGVSLGVNLQGNEDIEITSTHVQLGEQGELQTSRLLINGRAIAIRLEGDIVTLYGRPFPNLGLDVIWVDSNKDQRIDWVVLREDDIPIHVYQITSSGFVIDESERAMQYIQTAKETLEALSP